MRFVASLASGDRVACGFVQSLILDIGMARRTVHRWLVAVMRLGQSLQGNFIGALSGKVTSVCICLWQPRQVSRVGLSGLLGARKL